MNCRRKLKKLKSARLIFDEQNNFLIDLSDDFQKLWETAIKGDYEHDFITSRFLIEKHLSVMIVNMRMDFEKKIRTKEAQ